MTRIDEIAERWRLATPAPWHVSEQEKYHSLSVDVLASDDRTVIAEVWAGTGRGREQVLANVQAIAHAPEDIHYLLDVVQAFRQRTDVGTLPDRSK